LTNHFPLGKYFTCCVAHTDVPGDASWLSIMKSPYAFAAAPVSPLTLLTKSNFKSASDAVVLVFIKNQGAAPDAELRVFVPTLVVGQLVAPEAHDVIVEKSGFLM
jgi:hypothetical protein